MCGWIQSKYDNQNPEHKLDQRSKSSEHSITAMKVARNHFKDRCLPHELACYALNAAGTCTFKGNVTCCCNTPQTDLAGVFPPQKQGIVPSSRAVHRYHHHTSHHGLRSSDHHGGYQSSSPNNNMLSTSTRLRGRNRAITIQVSSGESRLYNVRRWVYQSSMVISIIGRLVYFTRLFSQPGELPVQELPASVILLLFSIVWVSTILAAAAHNLNWQVYGSFGIVAAMWPVDYWIVTKLISYLNPDPELMELAVRVLVVCYNLQLLVLSKRVLRHFKRGLYGIQAWTLVVNIFTSPTAIVTSLIGEILERKFGLRKAKDILARARLGRGSEYTVDYQVASVFYSSFSIVAALIGTFVQDTWLKSLMPALVLLGFPNLLSMGDGPRCFSFSAALNGVVEVKSVDELLLMTATTRQELLKSLLQKRRRSNSISRNNLCFARAALTGGLEIRRAFTASEIRDANVKICRHVIRYPDGQRCLVNKTAYSLLHVYRNQHAVVSEGHNIDECLSGEHGDLGVEGTL